MNVIPILLMVIANNQNLCIIIWDPQEEEVEKTNWSELLLLLLYACGWCCQETCGNKQQEKSVPRGLIAIRSSSGCAHG
jgi:hypothetical protein